MFEEMTLDDGLIAPFVHYSSWREAGVDTVVESA
jgi:hypothetical protein